VGVEFGKNVLDTTFDRLFRNIQSFADAAIVSAGCNESQHTDFARTQRLHASMLFQIVRDVGSEDSAAVTGAA
jgi:hypothetical protein